MLNFLMPPPVGSPIAKRARPSGFRSPPPISQLPGQSCRTVVEARVLDAKLRQTTI